MDHGKITDEDRALERAARKEWRATLAPMLRTAHGLLLAIGLEAEREISDAVDHVFETIGEREEHEVPKNPGELAIENLDAWWSLREGELAQAAHVAAKALDDARRAYDDHSARGKKLAGVLARLAALEGK